MASPVELQQRAVEYAKQGDFGVQALETNLELTRIAPANEGAWTRLARCYLESGQLDEATAALDTVLVVNPQNTIARNLHGEVTRRRAGATAAFASRSLPASRSRRAPRAASPTKAGSAPMGGFGRAEFAALGHLAPYAAAEALAPRMESLLMALNERPFAAKAVEIRNRAGRSGARLFRRNSFYPGSVGHIFAFHHGGRWEPQLNLGLYAASAFGRNCVRAGLGFNLSQDGADPDRDGGQERIVEQFERFQQLAAGEWRGVLGDWMGAFGGFIQHGDHPPATDLLPDAAIDWLVGCQNPVEVGWIFCGRWLFADRSDAAEILEDGRRLVVWMEQTFSDVLPLWSTFYRA